MVTLPPDPPFRGGAVGPCRLIHEPRVPRADSGPGAVWIAERKTNMDFQIALLLGQDGIVNGAVYGLMALALVLVFSVTRVIFIPQGEFVAFGALTMVMLQAGRTPATLWLLLALALTVLAVEGWRWKKGEGVNWVATAFWCVGMPLLAAALVLGVQPGSLWLQALTTLVLIAPLGPLLYRLVFRPLADASVLILLIVAVALHGVLVGAGLLFFGAEGSRIYTNVEIIEIPCVEADAVVDPTGCGDAYRAGLLYGIDNGMDWDQTGRLASLMGAIKIASRGGQNHTPSRDDIAEAYRAAFGATLW